MKFKIFIIALLSVVFSVGLYSTFSIENTTVELDGVYDLNETYMLGEEISIPQLELKVDGELLPTKIFIHQPNQTTIVKKQLRLTMPGSYIIEYSAMYSNQVYNKKFEFKVTRSLYNFTGTMSSAYYGRPSGYETAPEGIVVSLSQGERFEFNRVIDLRNYHDLNNFLSFYAAPSVNGELEARAVTITLTDIYDTSKYLTFRLYSFPASWALNNVYVTAGSDSQTLTGMEWTPPPSNPDIIQYMDRGILRDTLIHRNSNFGTSIHLPMDGKGTAADSIVGSRIIQFSYDVMNNALYGGMQTDSRKQLIADFDNPVVFNNVWEGFTTGEVKLSLSASEYLKDNLNLVLTNIDNKDISESEFTDTSAPAINIDYEGYIGQIPNGLIGIPYKIFDASATDDYDQDILISKKVYYNYRSKDRALFEVNNNHFIPTKEGLYTIVYEAKDGSGNKGLREVDVVVNNEYILTGVMGDYVDSAYVGEAYQLPSFDLFGLKGRGLVRIAAKLQGVNQIEYDLTGQTSFVPQDVGIYQIIYTYSDYVEVKVESINVEITYSGHPYLVLESSMPKYLIKNATYELPQQKAISFEGDNKTVKEATIFVYNDSKTTAEVNNGKELKVTANEKIRIVYSPSGDENDMGNISFEIPVVDVGYGAELDMSKYFDSYGVSSQAFRDGILLTYENGQGTAQFINPLLAHNFNLIFSIQNESNKFEAFNIYLEDSINSEQKLKFTYEKDNNGMLVFSINNGMKIDLSSSFGSESEIKIALDLLENIVFPKDDVTQDVQTYLNGSPFAGFDSQKVYMTLEFENVSGLSSVRIINISGQVTNDRNSDLLAPIIQAKNQRGEYEINTLITLNAAYTLDVLDPQVTFSLLVLDPHGNVVQSIDGVSLDQSANPNFEYQMKLEHYGRYRVTYTSSDTQSNRPQVFSYDLIVIDSQKPELSFVNVPVIKGSVGDTIAVASVKVKDNVDADLEVHVYIETPTSQLIKLSDTQFLAQEQGTYYVYYLVYDNAGNLSKLSYQVEISGRNS